MGKGFPLSQGLGSASWRLWWGLWSPAGHGPQPVPGPQLTRGPWGWRARRVPGSRLPSTSHSTLCHEADHKADHWQSGTSNCRTQSRDNCPVLTTVPLFQNCHPIQQSHFWVISKRNESSSQRDTGTPKFTAAFFITATVGKEPTCPLADNGETNCGICERYLALKRSAAFNKWVDLEDTMLSGIGQTVKTDTVWHHFMWRKKVEWWLPGTEGWGKQGEIGKRM